MKEGRPPRAEAAEDIFRRFGHSVELSCSLLSCRTFSTFRAFYFSSWNLNDQILRPHFQQKFLGPNQTTFASVAAIVVLMLMLELELVLMLMFLILLMLPSPLPWSSNFRLIYSMGPFVMCLSVIVTGVDSNHLLFLRIKF